MKRAARKDKKKVAERVFARGGEIERVRRRGLGGFSRSAAAHVHETTLRFF
jgi:hypothetical protein